MAADKNSSIEEIIAACRAADGGGASAAAPAPATPAAPAADVTPAAPAAPAAGGAKASASMSVEEMMAAARGEVAGGAKSSAGAVESAAAAAPAPAVGGKKPSQSMSVAEMMAAARGEKAGGAKPAGAKAAGAAKTAAPAAKAAPTKKANPNAAGADAGPRDTSSILAAARKSDGERRGPMSKSQAAELGKTPSKVKVAPPMPKKPAYAAPKPAKAGTDEDRRGVIGMLFGSFMMVGFSSLGLVSGLWGLGLARFLFPNILTEPPSQFKIGFPADFPPDSVVTKFKAQFGVWVVNSEYDGQQQITALMSVCTHLGCTPNWLEGEQKFKCPCHGSGFYKDGINFEGPAPRPLERYAIKIADDGQLEIDKSKSFQQEMGDWGDPSCFVPV